MQKFVKKIVNNIAALSLIRIRNKELQRRISMYCEPFIGGGAMFLRKQPIRA